MTSPVDRQMLFYMFSRFDSWVDPEFSYKKVSETEIFSPNASKIQCRPLKVPDWDLDWKMYDLVVPESESNRFFSEVEIAEGLLAQTPDVFPLGRDLYMSERAREALTLLGSGDQNFIPTKVSKTGPSGKSRSDLYIVIPRIVFYSDSEEHEDIFPDIDFHPSAFRTQLHQMQTETELTQFLGQLGMWCLIPLYSEPFFSPQLFQKLSQSGITGLDEETSDLHLRYNGAETIGHVYRTGQA
ncbi:MAG: hypothetical protein AAGE80_13610 [Pseudomonadota bacterium]